MSNDYFETTVTYLEMNSAPPIAESDISDDLALVQVDQISCQDYRHLYKRAGEQYNWTERLIISDEELSGLIHSPSVSIFIFEFKKQSAGYFELEFHSKNDIELKYFALFPAFHGKGLGRKFLRMAIQKAWSYDSVKRFWVHTCDMDHPAALPTYQKEGFQIYKTQLEKVPKIPTNSL